MDKKRVTVMVAGQKFTILTEEEEKYVIDIAAKVDARITSMAMNNMSREKAAVLTALDYADDNEKQRRETVEIREQIKDYIDSTQRLSDENAQLRTQIERLKDADTSDMDRATIAALEKEVEALRLQLKEQRQTPPAPTEDDAPPVAPTEEIGEEIAPVIPSQPVPAEPKAEEEYLNLPVEPTVKPQKKPRHEHRHENPFRQQFMNKQKDPAEQKGYAPRRQYSLFDDEE